MFGTERISRWAIIVPIVLIVSIFIVSPSINAQYWAAIPPYNTLWPLWSPVLNGISSKTGISSPLVTSLTSSTILPVQPALTWDPLIGYPWLLYNTTQGLGYWDQIFGFNFWPPDFLFNSITNKPIPLTLTGNWAALPPTPFIWGNQWVPLANAQYLTYPFAVSPIGTLLTALQIWGL